MSGVIVISGTRKKPTGYADEFVRMIMDSLWAPDVSAFVSGACVGVDQFVAQYLTTWTVPPKQFIVVPADRSRVDPDWLAQMAKRDEVTVVYMPPGTTYRDRNFAMFGRLNEVPKADFLTAFPDHEEEHPRSTRSGTWQTVRIARGLGLPSMHWPLAPM